MDLKLSKKYGLNPSIEKCFVCGAEMGIIMFGESYRDKEGRHTEALHEICTGNFCKECSSVIENGNVFILECRECRNEQERKNPYRTGRRVAIGESSFREIFKDCRKVNYMEENMFNEMFGNHFRKEENGK